MIAAHALSLDRVLVTDNPEHFARVPELKVENWSGQLFVTRPDTGGTG